MRVIAALAIGCAQLLYEGLKLVLPRRGKVVFLSRQSDTPSRDFLMLADELRALAPGVRVVVRTRFVQPGAVGKLAYLGEMLAQMRHLADASVCVVDGYIVPVSVLRHRPELLVVQMWHALGAIKQFGYQSLDRPGGRPSALAEAMRMHHNYGMVLCGGPASVPIFAEAFGTDPARVRPLGLPRVDEMLAHASDTFATSASPEVCRLATRFPRVLDAEKTVVLYAPTFRSGAPGDWEGVASAFPRDRYTVVIKPHFLDGSEVRIEHVVDAREVGIIDVLPLCDVVITDYSAVAFEALVLGLPVYFYVYDIDEYAEATGLNVDPRIELPDATSRDINVIAAQVAAGAYNIDAARAFSERFAPHSSGGCTHLIAEAIVPWLETK